MRRHITIIRRLESEYPAHAKTFLNHRTVFELLVATILSAQCTDTQVNRVTKTLFKKYATIQDYASAKPRELENYIRTTGYYRAKAKNIINSAKIVAERFRGRVPDNMEDLVTLPGVGRKTANIVLYAGYGKVVGIAVDTHVFRLSKRMGLTDSNTPEKTEKDLLNAYDRKYWHGINYLFIRHGRAVCRARNPGCSGCIVSDICQKVGVNKNAEGLLPRQSTVLKGLK